MDRSSLPDVSMLIEAARDIVLSAKLNDELQSLTVKSVRKQVEHEFSLNEGALDIPDIKAALRNAVDMAVAEEIVPVSTGKRTARSENAGDSEGAKPKKPKTIQQKKGKDKATVDGDEESASSVGMKKKKPRVIKSKMTIRSDSEDMDDTPDKTVSTSKAIESQSKPDQTENNSVPGSSTEDKQQAAEKSESELSVLLDGPPTLRGKQTKTKGKTRDDTKKPTKIKEKDSSKALSKDEETIKRLKALVSACGVRKSWSKEFADLSLPKQQIKRLKAILDELGMTSRPSIEKAKAIRNRRELARELNDVVEFERKAGASRNRSRPQTKTKRPIGELDTDSDPSESSEDEDEESPVKKNTASRSIMAYLANQSSGEE